MSPYLMLGLLLLFGTIIAPKSRTAYRIAFFVMLAFLSLRFGQGTDWGGYCYIYQAAPATFDFGSSFYASSLHGEFGWKLLMNAFKVLGFRFTTVSVVLSIVEMVLIDRFIVRHSSQPTLSLLMLYPTYYLTYLFSGLRQGLVLALFLGIMVDFAIDKKLFMYVLFCVLATLIHGAAIVLFLVPLTWSLELRTYQIALLFAFVLGIGGPLWIRFINVSYVAQTSISITALIYRAVVLVIALLSFGNWLDNELEESNKAMMRILLLGTVVYLAFFMYELVASRLAAILMSVEVAIIPNLLSKGRRELQRPLLVIVLAMSCVMVAKNLSSYVMQGGYLSQYQWYNYPYVSILNRDDIYNMHINAYDTYTLNA